MKTTTKLMKLTLALLSLGMLTSATAAISITASDLGGSYSAKQNNVYNGGAIWTAGSQISANGDSTNQRSGRVFLEFQLTTSMIAEANLVGTTATLSFNINSIGSGASGGPAYADGLDLRYLGVTAGNQTNNTLWVTLAVGSDQADILAVAGPLGSSTVALTAPTLVTEIAAATAGEWVAFAYLNTAGTLTAAETPVTNSSAQIYGFEINQTLANHSLTLTAVPEPSSTALLGLGGLALMFRRRR